MELWQLRYFVTVANTLSFSKAAELLYVSQPAISQQISELERELKVTLLERKNRKIQLTPAGRLLLQNANELLSHYADVLEQIRSQADADHEHETLRVGIERPLAWVKECRAIVEHAIGMLQKERSRVHVEIFSIDQNAGSRMFKENLVDVTVTGPPVREQDVAFAPLPIPGKLYLVYLKNEQTAGKSSREVLEEKGLAVQQNDMDGNQLTLEMLQQFGAKPQLRFYQETVDFVFAVEMGRTAAFCPDFLLSQLDTDRLFTEEIGLLPSGFCVSFNQKTASPACLRLVELLTEP